MTFGDFKKLILAYMTRSSDALTIDGVDMIASAANQARMWAEREHNFELCRLSAKIERVHFERGSTLDKAVEQDTGAKVSVKAIERAFLEWTDGSGQFPIEVMSRAKHMSELRRYYESLQSLDPGVKPASKKLTYFRLVHWGTKIYVTPADKEALGAEEFPVYVDIVKWLPDYKNDSDTDFFLEHCVDFLKFRTIYELNFMLKEDLRVPISEKALERSWLSVQRWDAAMIGNSAEDTDLD